MYICAFACVCIRGGFGKHRAYALWVSAARRISSGGDVYIWCARRRHRRWI